MSSHVVVVGGSKGLGLTVVSRFLDKGYDVTVLSRNPPDGGHERLRHIKVDLEKLKDFNELDLSSLEHTRPVRYLVLSQRFRGKGDAWAGEIQVGLTASRILIEGFLDFFAKDGDRAILAVSSVYAQFAGGSQPVGYHVVKGGLNALVRYYAWALGSRGVRVNAILPLTFVQERSRAFYESNEALQHMYERLVPLGRMGDVANNADAIEFLCSERAAFINGQALFIDGGVSAIWQEQIAQSFSGA